MKAFTFPAFRPDGIAVRLAELLAVIPENELVWSVLDFYGIGEAPDNFSMDEFEQVVRKKPGGFMMSWPELKKFADRLDQSIDCVIVGARSEQDVLKTNFAENDFVSCEIVLSVFDSTEWSVWAREEKLMKRLASVY